MSETDQFLDDILQFLKRTGMSESSFGVEAMGDPSFIAKLRKGRSVRLKTAEDVRNFMRDYRPRQKKATSEIAAA